MKRRERRNAPTAASPEMMNWLCQSPKWLRVWVATMLTIRLPATGPTVQNPMAEARPSCGLKSRTRAGVATRMAPSTSPMAQMTVAKVHSLEAFGTPTASRRPTINRP